MPDTNWKDDNANKKDLSTPFELAYESWKYCASASEDAPPDERDTHFEGAVAVLLDIAPDDYVSLIGIDAYGRADLKDLVSDWIWCKAKGISKYRRDQADRVRKFRGQ